MAEPVLLRQCTRCKQELSLDHFWHTKTSKGTRILRSRCKKCLLEEQKERDEKLKKGEGQRLCILCKRPLRKSSSCKKCHRCKYHCIECGTVIRNGKRCKKCGQEYASKYMDDYRKAKRYRNKQWYEQTKKWRDRVKEAVLHHYGKGDIRCVRCGFSDIRALCLDHVDGKSGKLRSKNGRRITGFYFYRWLIQNGYPDIVQILCANCNTIKQHENNEWVDNRRPPKEEST